MKKKEVVVGKMVRVCPSDRHAWFESNVGPVRKQYNGGKGTLTLSNPNVQPVGLPNNSSSLGADAGGHVG